MNGWRSKNSWTEIQSRSIDLLRFPMAVAVVMLHYSTSVISDASGTLKVFCVVFQEGLCRLAVPCFFLISGYLFYNQLQGWDWIIWKRKIKSRVKTLLVPYILWIIIDFFAYWLYSLILGEGTSVVEHFTKVGGIRIFWGTDGGIPISIRSVPLDGPLWFIRDLMYYTLATPLLYYFITKTGKYGVAAVIVAFLLTGGIIPEGFVFFLVGSFLQLEKKNICELVWPRRRLLYISALALVVIFYCVHDLNYWNRLIKNLFIFVGIGAVFCLATWLLQTKKIKVNLFLVQSSFFIFAAHEVLILRQIAVPCVRLLFPVNGPTADCIRYFLVPAVAVLICLLILRLLKILVPNIANILTGARQSNPKSLPNMG